MVGMRYHPFFDWFEGEERAENAWQVVTADYVTTSGRYRRRPHGSGVRRGRLRDGAEARHAALQPGRTRRHVLAGRSPRRRDVVQGGRQTSRPRPARTRPDVSPRNLPPQLPARLAQGHAAALVPGPQLVRPHDRLQRPTRRTQRHHRLESAGRRDRADGRVATAATSTGRLRRSRYWGTPLPIWTSDRDPDSGRVHRVDRRAARQVRRRLPRRRAQPRDRRTRPAPPLRRRHHVARRQRRHHAAHARPDRRVVRQRGDAVRPVALPVRKQGAV